MNACGLGHGRQCLYSHGQGNGYEGCHQRLRDRRIKARWASKAGHELLFVEVSPQLLGSAYVIDFLDGGACRFLNDRTTIL